MRQLPIILGTLFIAMSLTAADFDATWKLDLAKSKPGNDLVSETMKIEPTGPASHRTTIEAELKSGQKQHQELDRIYDGKEHTLVNMGAKQEGSTEICEQVDASTRKITQKKDGKFVSALTSTVSADGKTLTVVRTGRGAETLVFRKQ